MSKKVLKQSAVSTITRLIVMFLNLVGIGMVSRVLDREPFGIYAFLSSLIFISGIISFGFGSKLQNKLVELQYLGQDMDSSIKQKEIFFATFYSMLTICLVVGFLFSLFTYNLDTGLFIKTSDASLMPIAKWLIALFILAQFVMQPFSLSANAMYAFDYIDLNNVLQLIMAVFNIVTIFSAASLGGGLITLSLISTFLPLISAMMMLFVFMYIQKWHFITISINRIMEIVSGFLKESALFWLLNISALCIHQTGVFMVSLVSDISVTGDFSFYQKAFYAMAMVHLSALMPLWPSFSHENEKGNFIGMAKMLKQTVFLTLLYFGTCIAVVALCGPILVKFWAGREVHVESVTIISLSLWALFYGWLNVFSVFLNGIGKIKVQTTTAAIVALILFPFSYYLGKKVGVAGIPLATAILLAPAVIILPMEVMTYLKKHMAYTGILSRPTPIISP